jgi:hypothetical protein
MRASTIEECSPVKNLVILFSITFFASYAMLLSLAAPLERDKKGMQSAEQLK